MPIQLDPRVQRSDSILVADVHQPQAPGDVGHFSVTFRPSTTLEAISRKLRNLFSFGLHSRLSVNPTQWRTLKASLLFEAHQSGKPHLNERVVDRLLGAYSDSDRLTAAKLNNVLADFERAKADPDWQPQFNPKYIDTSQNPLARGARSLQQLARGLTPAEDGLKELATWRQEEYATARAEFEGILRETIKKGTRPEAAILDELNSGIYAAKSIAHILRPGRGLSGDDVNYFMAALQRRATQAGQTFGYVTPNHYTNTVDEVLHNIPTQYRDHIRNVQGQKKGMFTIPLVLAGRPGRENHVILLAIDSDRKQINVLDSNGLSIEDIESSYVNSAGFKASLETLGKSVFGQNWQAQQNILQMNIPKQQGAMDCGAFVCDFAKQLVYGKSVGDIERTFKAEDRSALRLNAAKLIKEEFLDQLDEDVNLLRAARGEFRMPQLVQRYKPTAQLLLEPTEDNDAVLAATQLSTSKNASEKLTTLSSSTANPKPKDAPKTDTKRENRLLYAADPPFGVGGTVKGHYVQRQFGECCFAHSLASYFQKPIFANLQEFLDFRNVSYDNLYGGLYLPEELEASKREELSNVEPVKDVLIRLQNDATKNFPQTTVPWVSGLFRVVDPGAAVALDSGLMKAKIDDAFTYLAEQSESKRFIVRSGGNSGHFQTLVYEPEMNHNAPWTLLNSSSDLKNNSLLPEVASGSSPAELLGAHTTRGLVLGIWTQSNNPETNLDWQNLMTWTPPNLARDGEFELI